MNKKYLSIKLLIIVVFFTQISNAGNDHKKAIASQQKLLRAFGTIYTNYADELEPMELANAAIDGMTNKLDPYTVHLQQQQKFRMDMLTRGNYGGVGIRIGSRHDTLTVISPMEDSPAWQAGILPGDRIIRIDSLYTKGKKIDDLAEKIRGPEGTIVQLTILRGSEKEKILFHLTRKKIEVKEIPYAGFIQDKIAYIKLNGFSKNASKQVRYFADSLQHAGMEYLILDLRNNTGGLLDQAVKILNLYLPKGEKVVHTKGLTRGSNREYYLRDKPIISNDVRIAILVNQGSASASEIVAGSTQDLNRGIIVGQTTFGKGLVQNIFPLDDSSAVKVTTSKYYIPSGRLIQKEDYFHENDIVSANAEIEHTFYTKSGRKVKENGGIEPDSTVKNDKQHFIIVDLWRQYHFSEFAREIMLKYPDRSGEENTELYFQEFIEYLHRNNYHFDHPLHKKLEKLEKQFFAEFSEEEKQTFEINFINLRAILNQNTDELLLKNKDDIIPFLRAEILGFRGGQYARIKGSLKDDKVLNTAIELLKNDAYLKKYNIIPFFE